MTLAEGRGMLGVPPRCTFEFGVVVEDDVALGDIVLRRRKDDNDIELAEQVLG